MKYNKPENVRKLKTMTLNKEGGKAFKPSEKFELVLRAATTLGKTAGFYESACESDRQFVKLINSVAQTDPEFVLKLAWYTRKKFYLRTPAIVLLAEAARAGTPSGVYNAKRYVSETISRVDDMTELVAYCLKMNEKVPIHKGKLPMLIKRGIAQAFGKFDEYQFAKYTNQDMLVSPQDVMFMAHPAPRKGQKKLFEKIAEGNLAVPETWEDYIRTNGSTKENWTYILDKMGYMGIVRNLRNLLEKGVNAMDIAYELTDKDRVMNSKMLPFRFYSAYRVLENTHPAKLGNTGKIMGALSVAMDISAANLKKFEGNTAIFCDNSGSMTEAKISDRSTVQYNDVGNLFGAILAQRSQNAMVATYGTNAVMVNINPRDSILTNTQKIGKTSCGGGSTYTYKCLDLLAKEGAEVGRMVFFTDEQGYGRPSAYDRLKQYRKDTGTNPYVYTFDIRHYGTTQFPENEPRHTTIGGWSDNILKFIHLFEADRTRLTDDIENAVVAG